GLEPLAPAALNPGLAGHSIVPSSPCALVTAGAVVSCTVIVCVRLVLFPQLSVAVHVRAITCAQFTTLVVVTTLGAITPSHASVNTGALNTGLAGHSIVPSSPCALVSAGGEVSGSVMVCVRSVLFPQLSVAVHVRAITCAQFTTLVVVTTLGAITPSHASVNTGALNTGLAGHSIVPSSPCALVTAGAVVSCTVIVCVRLVLFPQLSVAVHVRAITCAQFTTLVVVTTLGAITPSHASVNTGALNTGLAGHSIVPSSPCALVTAGAVVSCTVIVCVRLVLFPQLSVAVHVRAITCAQFTTLVVVTTLGAITPSHASVNTGALNTGLAGHSIVPSSPCALVTAGAVVSCTVIVCVRLVLFPQLSVAVHVRAITCAQFTTLVVVATLGAITPSHASVNTGALNTGLAGHSIVPSSPC